MNFSPIKNFEEHIFSNQEQISDFYETLRNGPHGSFEQFQSILEVFLTDLINYRKEIKRLEDSFKREKETNEKYLRHIEEDQERDIRQLEEKIRNEERRKFELERELFEQRTAKEIGDLQSSLQHLKTIERLYTSRRDEEDSLIVSLREEIGKLTTENQNLNVALNDSLTTTAILQSDLQSFKSQLTERQTMLLQEKLTTSSSCREKESLQTNVRHLVQVNKQLRDENDSLRAIIDSNKFFSNSNEESLSSKQLMREAGSSLDIYWNSSKNDSPTSSCLNSSNHQHRHSFDVESVDELGTSVDGSRDDQNLSIKPSSTLSTSISDRFNEKNNFTNDSGLSLATARDVNEIESDPEIQARKFQRTINRKNENNSDSDDAFVDVSFEKQNSRQSYRQRIVKHYNENPNSSPKTPSNLPIPRSQSLRCKRSTPSPFFTNRPVKQVFDAPPFDRMYKVVFCGDAAVGKTTLIMRLCKGKYLSNINSTLGVDFQNKQIDLDGKRVAIQLWDTAGQERFRSMAKSYFRRCDGVILVYDSTYERSFLNVREWINTVVDSTSKKASVMIVANKIDLRDQMRSEGKRVIEQAEGAKLAKEYRVLFIETSAKDGTNSTEALIELTRDMQCNEDLERLHTTGINLDRTTKKSGCCGTKS